MGHATTDQIPDYLQPYIVRQDPSFYTAMDHASWRFILKISQVFFAKHAHKMYLDGLHETGISTDRIPLISEMDAKLRRFGWRAVAVSGFIPPAVFMEFLSRGVLPIACDMRKLENLSYTPAPDIVHEAAGHAPIIADPEYAKYLRHYGELAEKAIFSNQDMDVYNAIRELSEIKEDPKSTDSEIEAAQKKFEDACAAVDHDSEATQLGRMGWWTIEYGLLGDLSDPKIYGAGLLSSVGESYNCLNPEVKKVPFSVDCVKVTYDITRPQPQLFIASSFDALTKGLDEYAKTMAFRLGGLEGLERARKARATTTAVLDSGIQVSGTLIEYRKDLEKQPSYLRYAGATQLSFGGSELEGQGPEYHKEGFSTALGPVLVDGKEKNPADLTRQDLEILGFRGNEKGQLEYTSGILVDGVLKNVVQKNGKNLILTLSDCTMRIGSETLFRPEWGTFDLACGVKVTSVFGWAADRAKYLGKTGGFSQQPAKQKSNLTEATRALNDLYAELRKIRDTGVPSEASTARLAVIHDQLEFRHRDDWLLRYELLELDAKYGLKSPWAKTARKSLEGIAKTAKDKAEMISRGLEIL